jgi:hypothetical protein
MTSHHYNVVIRSLDSRTNNTVFIRYNNEISALQDAILRNCEASIINCDNNDEDFLCCIDPHIPATRLRTRIPGALVSDLDDAGWCVYEKSELVQLRPDTSAILAMNVEELRVILARQTNILYMDPDSPEEPDDYFDYYQIAKVTVFDTWDTEMA